MMACLFPDWEGEKIEEKITNHKKIKIKKKHNHTITFLLFFTEFTELNRIQW